MAIDQNFMEEAFIAANKCFDKAYEIANAQNGFSEQGKKAFVLSHVQAASTFYLAQVLEDNLSSSDRELVRIADSLRPVPDVLSWIHQAIESK